MGRLRASTRARPIAKAEMMVLKDFIVIVVMVVDVKLKKRLLVDRTC
jgi:hypothetical protein